MLAETSTVLRQKQYGFCQILSPDFTRLLDRRFQILCAIYARVSTTNNGQDPTMQPRRTKDSRPEDDRLMADAHKHRVAGCHLAEEFASITRRADAARMLFRGEDLFEGDGQGAQKRGS
jgi:hypothetical protein